MAWTSSGDSLRATAAPGPPFATFSSLIHLRLLSWPSHAASLRARIRASDRWCYDAWPRPAGGRRVIAVHGYQAIPLRPSPIWLLAISASTGRSMPAPPAPWAETAQDRWEGSGVRLGFSAILASRSDRGGAAATDPAWPKRFVPERSIANRSTVHSFGSHSRASRVASFHFFPIVVLLRRANPTLLSVSVSTSARRGPGRLPVFGATVRAPEVTGPPLAGFYLVPFVGSAYEDMIHVPFTCFFCLPVHRWRDGRRVYPWIP